MNSNQATYCEWAAKQDNLSIFAQPWWLDATCGNENWDVFIQENNFAFAYHHKQKFFQKALLPSVLTPYQPCANFDASIIHQLKQFDFIEWCWKDFDESIKTNLAENNFQITTKHTRVLDLTDVENVFKNFKPSLQRQIRKAEKNLTIKNDDDLETFFKVSTQTFQAQKKAIPYSFEQLKMIDDACKKNNAGCFMMAYNAAQQPCAAIYLVFDKTCCYYLLGGVATEFKNTGAMCLLLWQSIQFAASKSKTFDFCGSTIPSIDNFFSTFGAEKKEVLLINRYKNQLQKLVIEQLKK